MARWEKKKFRLPEASGWKAKPGYQIFVADRGAVRFDIPSGWVVVPAEGGSICFYDRQPPDDNCRLQLSVMRLPPIRDWRELPLPKLLTDVLAADDRECISQSEVVYVDRADLELAWIEFVFIDPGEKREAHSRCCLARGANIQPLITMEFWSDEAERYAPVWDEVLRSLQLGVYIKDPLRPRYQ